MLFHTFLTPSGSSTRAKTVPAAAMANPALRLPLASSTAPVTSEPAATVRTQFLSQPWSRRRFPWFFKPSAVSCRVDATCCGMRVIPIPVSLSRALCYRCGEVLKSVSQLLLPGKDREEWFSLRENHERVLGSGLHQLGNCSIEIEFTQRSS